MAHKRWHIVTAWLFVTFVPFVFNACGQGFSASSLSPARVVSSGESSQIVLSWASNREAAVNAAGGGYRVYYSTSSNVTTASQAIVVPYASGSSTPTSVGLTGFSPGTYYARIQAYSSKNAGGSALSTAIQFTVLK